MASRESSVVKPEGKHSRPPSIDESHPLAYEDEIPNGGFFAWYQVVGSFCLFMNGWGIINTFGVYQTFYETQLLAGKQSSSNISWIGSVQACLLVLVGVITGPLFDRGYLRPLLLVGSFLVVLGLMMTSLCTEYWQIMLAQGLTIGLGSGCLFVPSVAVLPTYFTTKKATVLGIAACGSSLGGVIYPIVFHRLQPSVGFGWATRTIAFIALCTLLIPLAGMRTRTKPNSTRKMIDWNGWRELPFTLFSFACLFGYMGLYIPFYYIGLYAEQKGVSAELSFYLVAILNAGSFFGRLIPSLMADRMGPLNMIIPFVSICIVLSLAWLRITDAPGLIALSVLYGFFSGCFVSLPPATVATLCPSLDVVGARMGMNFTLAAVGLLVGNPIAGAILRANMEVYDWSGLIGWCAACISVATIFTVAARIAKAGWRIDRKA